MAMYLRATIIDKKTDIDSIIFKSSLEYLLGFDGDITGCNGLEFVSKEAKNNGFDNEIDYVISKLRNKYISQRNKKLEDYIKNYMEEFLSMIITSYYDEYKTEIEYTDEFIIISVAVHVDN